MTRPEFTDLSDLLKQLGSVALATAYPPTTFVEIPEAGHGLNADGKQAIHQWIEDTFL